MNMIKVGTSVLVNKPIKEVFDFVTTPENDEKWYVGVESWDHTPGEPAGVGSTSQSKIRFLGIPVTVTWKVTGYEAPNKIAVETIEGPVTVEAGYTLESVAADQTKVSVKGEADLQGVWDLAEPLVERVAQRQWKTSFENLKDVLEG
jgi:carbon monoxide dehydrogenase subunit G